MQQSALAGLTPDDIASIRRISDVWVTGVLAQDFDGMAKVYTGNAVLMAPHCPAVHGREAIRNWMAAFPTITHFKFEHCDIDGCGSLAYVRGSYAMTFQPEGAPGPIEDVGKFIEIRRKQPDGAWLITADIFNSDK